ncbi:hypothetical protein POM88_018567 [Heracleum sosnowskyi]|uniref:Uncharacterized protein n=1 Tax=Heracleum sosnowskyi TaxID=360622 RepID=A0AAD8ISR3_9APIA|nr:hypothetical protein POM88_018567 [Heracleum sosnowskyi]
MPKIKTSRSVQLESLCDFSEAEQPHKVPELIEPTPSAGSETVAVPTLNKEQTMEENQRLKKGKQTLEDSTMKRLSEMENALRKASGQMDRANAVVRRLETENADIRAEMEASKLSVSESVNTCLEVFKEGKEGFEETLCIYYCQ